MYSGKVKITDNTIFIKTNNNVFAYLLLKHKNLNRLVFISGQPLIKSSDLQNLTISISETEKEQNKVSSFFDNLDKQIKIQSDKLESFKRAKKGYLQKIFPSDDSDKPKLRLKGFNDN